LSDKFESITSLFMIVISIRRHLSPGGNSKATKQYVEYKIYIYIYIYIYIFKLAPHLTAATHYFIYKIYNNKKIYIINILILMQ